MIAQEKRRQIEEFIPLLITRGRREAALQMSAALAAIPQSKDGGEDLAVLRLRRVCYDIAENDTVLTSFLEAQARLAIQTRKGTVIVQ